MAPTNPDDADDDGERPRVGETATASDVSKSGGGNKTPAKDGSTAEGNDGATTSAPAAATPVGAPAVGATKSPPKSKPAKVKVHLVAVGNAPILKKSKFLMNADDRFAVAIAFLRRLLKLSPSSSANGKDAAASSVQTTAVSASSLFLYVNSAFVPSPDERLGDLFDCFGVRGELVVHYSLQEAWG